MTVITARPLSRAAFAAYGDVIAREDAGKGDQFAINSGDAVRLHNLAAVDIADGDADGRAVISLVVGKPRAMPFSLIMVERHPLGSQAFIPLCGGRLLTVVCPDQNGVPGAPEAFVGTAGQGVNYHRGTWHAPLSPLDESTEFIVVDRDGAGENLQEHHFDSPWQITLPAALQFQAEKA